MRAQFASRHHVIVSGLFAPAMLGRVESALAAARFEHAAAGEICLDRSIPSDRAPYPMLWFLANTRDLFSMIRTITGCGPIGCFRGRVFRIAPATEDHYDWHDDHVDGRLVALSTNLNRTPCEGGELLLRETDAARHDVIANTEFGNSVIFRVTAALEHRIAPVFGAEPRTAFAGWFCDGPRFEDVLAPVGSEPGSGSI
jgi:hypothetical protein